MPISNKGRNKEKLEIREILQNKKLQQTTLVVHINYGNPDAPNLNELIEQTLLREQQATARKKLIKQKLSSEELALSELIDKKNTLLETYNETANKLEKLANIDEVIFDREAQIHKLENQLSKLKNKFQQHTKLIAQKKRSILEEEYLLQEQLTNKDIDIEKEIEFTDVLVVSTNCASNGWFPIWFQKTTIDHNKDYAKALQKSSDVVENETREKPYDITFLYLDYLKRKNDKLPNEEFLQRRLEFLDQDGYIRGLRKEKENAKRSKIYKEKQAEEQFIKAFITNYKNECRVGTKPWSCRLFQKLVPNRSTLGSDVFKPPKDRSQSINQDRVISYVINNIKKNKADSPSVRALFAAMQSTQHAPALAAWKTAVKVENIIDYYLTNRHTLAVQSSKLV